MESFAGQSQINTLGEAVSTLLVSSSYFSVDQSYPITVEVMGGVTKTIVVSKRLYGIPFFPACPFISSSHFSIKPVLQNIFRLLQQ